MCLNLLTVLRYKVGGPSVLLLHTRWTFHGGQMHCFCEMVESPVSMNSRQVPVVRLDFGCIDADAIEFIQRSSKAVINHLCFRSSDTVPCARLALTGSDAGQDLSLIHI